MTASDPNRFERSMAARRKMLREQIEARGIQDRRLLDAIAKIPREAFLAHDRFDEAYADRALQIDYGQTISQPYTVAFMCQAAALKDTDRVLEIGTGSGYGAAVLSRLCKIVHSLERIPELADRAKKRIELLGIKNVRVHVCDGTLGLQTEAPFDAIVVTAAASQMPQPLADQLGEGGRLVIPIGSRNRQALCRFTRNGSHLKQENLGAFVFVPLIGAHGWPESSNNF